MTSEEKFGQQYGMNEDRVRVLFRRARALAKLGVKVCNGDPHPKNRNQDDKSENARLWQHVLDCDAVEVERYAQQYGFKGIEFNGLTPSLITKDGHTVILPLGD